MIKYYFFLSLPNAKKNERKHIQSIINMNSCKKKKKRIL